MDYEKEYNHAFEIAKGYWGGATELVRGILESMFPQLAGSEDERIRKQIEQVLIEHDWSATYKVSKDDCLDYIEKQKGQKDSTPDDIAAAYQMGLAKGRREQKPVDLVAELKHHLATTPKEQLEKEWKELEPFGFGPTVEEYLYGKPEKPQWSDSVAKEMFIKALERAVEQTKKGYELTDCDKHSWWEDFKAYSGIRPAEWSEEDFEYVVGELIQDVIANEKDAVNYGDSKKPTSFFVKKYIERFSSLRPQPHWKPSEKQIEVFFKAVPVNLMPDELAVYHSLYNDLKKL